MNIITDIPLPDITITNNGAVWTVVVVDYTLEQAGILDFALSIERAVELADACFHAYLNAATQPPPKLLVTFTTRPVKQRKYKLQQVLIRLSDTAWNHHQKQSRLYSYNGKSTTTGITHYWRALLAANPDPALHWRDNRPDILSDLDESRLRINKFPLWAPMVMEFGADRRQRAINREHWLDVLVPRLLPIANHFYISTYRNSQTSVTSRASAVLEAIGYSYLIPANPPIKNPKPVNPANYRPSQSHKSKWQLVF